MYLYQSEDTAGKRIQSSLCYTCNMCKNKSNELSSLRIKSTQKPVDFCLQWCVATAAEHAGSSRSSRCCLIRVVRLEPEEHHSSDRTTLMLRPKTELQPAVFRLNTSTWITFSPTEVLSPEEGRGHRGGELRCPNWKTQQETSRLKSC